MPLTLAARIGTDTLGKLERAARRRYAEALHLAPDEPLGAIYLFGYTIEIRLKAAYYRVVGLATPSPIDRVRRQFGESRIRTLLLLSSRTAVGHNLIGWARLLEDARASTPGVAALPLPMATQMYAHVQNVAACWTEVLRYRANKPYNEELTAVRSGAEWFKRNARRLWS